MKKSKKKYKSVIDMRIFQSLKKIGLVFGVLFFVLTMGKIGGTNAFFADSATVSGNVFSAGYWIPTIQMSVNPSAPDGEDGYYKTTPCVTLSANINGEQAGISIYYKFSEDGNPITNGEKYHGTCIAIPDGDLIHFEAQAVNDENSSWVSNVVSQNFKVKTVAQPGDVVINEVMWMGSTGSNADEWIELRNMTGMTVDIGNWAIENAKHSGNNKISIPEGKTVGPHGYFLIANYAKTDSNSKLNVDVDYVDNDLSLHDIGNGNLKLNEFHGNTIDEAKGGIWPAGWHGILLHMSMERNNDPGDGINKSSWHTCVDSDCNNTKYWDNKGTNFGTPGAQNLSVNDPSAPEYDPAVMEQTFFDEQELAVEQSVVESVVPAKETDAVPMNEIPVIDNKAGNNTSAKDVIEQAPVSEPIVAVDELGNTDAIIKEVPAQPAQEEIVKEKSAETSKVETVNVDEEKAKAEADEKAKIDAKAKEDAKKEEEKAIEEIKVESATSL
jgi:predicted ribosomally synthesized peptide with SipW-like signal peptide